MNTNNLKRFAREARIKLIDQVGRKLEFVLSNADPVFIDTNASQIQSLKNKIQEQGKEQVIDTVAYTWFNRLMALRFMDANGYTSPKVVTPIVGKSPELLQNALSGQIDENLKINRQRLNDLLDGKVVIADAQTEAYKMLLIASCNQWHTAMPFMFERISDYTELLLPDDLLSENSIITDIRNGMSDEDCGQEELIGWLYQFYIADKKDDVFEGLKKNIKITAENIPAATQLFTPRWIVRYMVENTLGKLWLTLKPNSKIRQFMPYYIEAPEGNAPAPLPAGIKGVTDITFLDPCQGSGHVLVYAFDLFTKIYEEEGYNTNEIPALILEHNLFGIDIDERAAQLAAFALTMKARSYFSRFLRKPVQPHVIALENVNEDIIKQAVKLPLAVAGKLVYDYRDLTLYNLIQADNFGSLIQIDPEELKALSIQKGSIWQAQEQKLKEQAEYLSRQYHCVVTNPPYMGARFMNGLLKNWLQKLFPAGSGDLLAAFIIRCRMLTYENGLTGMITLHGWMFISTFSDLRHWLLRNCAFSNLVHIGGNSFPSMNSQIARAVSFVLASKENNSVKHTACFDLDSVANSHSIDKEELFNTKISNKEIIKKDFSKFEKVQSYTFLYSVTDSLLEVFIKNKTVGEIAKPRQGLATGDNASYVRFWYEVSFNKQYVSGKDNPKWFTYNKGGDFRKWYGNNQFIVNWENNGLAIKNNFDSKGKLKSRPQNSAFYFKPGITYSLIGNTSFCARKYWEGHLFDVIGSAFFADINIEYLLLGLVNSSVGTYLLSKLNPTIAFQVGDICNIPILIPSDLLKNEIEKIVTDCIELAKNEASFFEENYEYKTNPFVENKIADYPLEDLVKTQIAKMQNRIKDLYNYEDRLNSIFTELYNISSNQKENIPITINLFGLWKLRGENDLSQIAGLNGLLINNIVSYQIGCLFGRYSIDKPGLILANQGENYQDFLKLVPSPSFMPDEDNIIPVLEGEWFNDDIVGRFKVLLKAAFGEVHFEENLKYIEDTIGKDIRKYFVKDFYNDHIKRYKKRPIYWMFSSPKGHFKALIYMHRYTPDLCSKMLTDYLQSYIHKMEAAQQNKIAESLREDLPARDKTAATKEADRYSAMIKDCKEYAQTLYAVATKKITIDLDDGVKVNYQKFKEVLVPIKGLEKEEE